MKFLEFTNDPSCVVFMGVSPGYQEVMPAFCTKSYSDPMRDVSIPTGIRDSSCQLRFDEAFDNNTRVDVRCEAQDCVCLVTVCAKISDVLVVATNFGKVVLNAIG